MESICHSWERYSRLRIFTLKKPEAGKYNCNFCFLRSVFLLNLNIKLLFFPILNYTFYDLWSVFLRNSKLLFRLEFIGQKIANVNISISDITFVSIHIRLTDYPKNLGLAYDLQAVGLDYFDRAITYFRKKFEVKKKVVLICKTGTYKNVNF